VGKILRMLVRRLGLLIAFTTVFIGPLVYAQQVVVSHDVGIERLSTSALRTIFAMRRQSWDNGLPITVFVYEPKQVFHRNFCQSVLNVLPYQLQRTWDIRVFSGMGQGPVIVYSEQEMLQRIATTSGAIGYVTGKAVYGQVKAISID